MLIMMLTPVPAVEAVVVVVDDACVYQVCLDLFADRSYPDLSVDQGYPVP